MFKATTIASAALIGLSSMSLATVPARAGGEGIAAGIIGFTAGAIVGSQLTKNKQRRVYHTAPRRSAEERQYWMTIQAALNRSGYDAGPVDGAPGRRTRAAVREFQLSLPAEPTGTLTPQQTEQLMALANPQPTQYQPTAYQQPGNQPGVPPVNYQQVPNAQAPQYPAPQPTAPNYTAAPTPTAPNQGQTYPVATTAPVAPAPTAPAPQAEAPAATGQAQVQIDESGQPFIMVNGQKILLQSGSGGN